MTNMKLDEKGRKHTTSTRSTEVHENRETETKQPKATTKSNMEKTTKKL